MKFVLWKKKWINGKKCALWKETESLIWCSQNWLAVWFIARFYLYFFSLGRPSVHPTKLLGYKMAHIAQSGCSECVCAHFFEFIFERFVTKIEFTTHNTNTCTHSGPVWFSSCVPNYRNLVCDSMPMPKRAQKRTSMYTVHTHTRVRHQCRDKSRFRCKSIIIFSLLSLILIAFI